MLQDGNYIPPTHQDEFPLRLRQVVDSYGSTNALAKTIERSEGAIRKWLRGQSEPSVSDLRAICLATNTSVEWLVMGHGDPKGLKRVGGEELGKVSPDLMEKVVETVGLDTKIEGVPVTPKKCAGVLTLVYNMSRAALAVDRESAQLAVALALR